MYIVSEFLCKQIAVGMEEELAAYTCNGAIIFAVAGGITALAPVALTTSSFVLSKKAKNRG